MKVTKREFVKGATAAVASSGLLGGRRALASGISEAPVPTSAAEVTRAADVTQQQAFDAIVYNDLFPRARAFAAGFSDRGTRTLPVAGDAGTLWYGTLRGLVTNGHRRIAGLTTHTDLLILETLARDKGLRVSRREDAGRLVSWVLI